VKPSKWKLHAFIKKNEVPVSVYLNRENNFEVDHKTKLLPRILRCFPKLALKFKCD